MNELSFLVAAPPASVVAGGHGGGPVPLWFAIPFGVGLIVYLSILAIAAWRLTRREAQ